MRKLALCRKLPASRAKLVEKRMIRAVVAGAVLVSMAGAVQAQGMGEALTRADVQALREAAQATAKATRDTADYVRVTPDILHQILAKLDKIENKLDKLENLQRANAPRQRQAR